MGTVTTISDHPRYRRHHRVAALLRAARRRPPRRSVRAADTDRGRAAGDYQPLPTPRPRLSLVGARPGHRRRLPRAMAALGVACLVLVGLLVAGVPAAGRPAHQHRPAPAGTAAPHGGYGWPLPGTPRVVRRFDPPPQRWLPGHRGVDLAGAPGEPVLAAGAGVVAFAGPVAGTGVVSIRHPDGLRTTYQPVEAIVHAGERVRAGQRLGTLRPGHPGCPAPACLHWGLRRRHSYLDPLLLLGFGRVRLLPTDHRRPARVDRPARRGTAGHADAPAWVRAVGPGATAPGAGEAGRRPPGRHGTVDGDTGRRIAVPVAGRRPSPAGDAPGRRALQARGCAWR